nr:MAG TPA: hypothetical protein [Caudoviricetes sp.]
MARKGVVSYSGGMAKKRDATQWQGEAFQCHTQLW